MSLYRVAADKLEAVPDTTFAKAKMLERQDIQRLLKQDITSIGEDLLVIAEEYGNWEDSHRRIDLLCLATNGDLVVVEIKRTEDGGHMELQAIRYAAMISSLTLEEVVQALANTLGCPPEDARSVISDFLDRNDGGEEELSGEVRIVLVSANFSTELTTAVLWLTINHNLNITCIRLHPYQLGKDTLIDATQIIPLPEAGDYLVKKRAQETEKRQTESIRHQIYRKFWAQLIERSKAKTDILSNRSTSSDHWLTTGIGRTGFSLTLVLNQNRSSVEVYIRHPEGDEQSTAAFLELRANRENIEKHFGGELDWQQLPERKGCRVCVPLEGGWKTPESGWEDLQDRLIDHLIRFETALRPAIQELSV